MLLTLQRVLRLHSVTDGILSVVVWHVNATAMVVGYFKPQKDPLQTIRARVLHPAQ